MDMLEQDTAPTLPPQQPLPPPQVTDDLAWSDLARALVAG